LTFFKIGAFCWNCLEVEEVEAEEDEVMTSCCLR